LNRNRAVGLLFAVSVCAFPQGATNWVAMLEKANQLRDSDASDAESEYRNAERVAATAGPVPLARVWSDKAALRIRQRRFAEAAELSRKALDVFERNDLGAAYLSAHALGNLAQASHGLGQHKDAQALLFRAVAILEQPSVPHRYEDFIPAIGLLGHYLVESGRLDDARTFLRQGIGPAKAAGNLPSLVARWTTLAELERTLGAMDEARIAARTALGLVQSQTPIDSTAAMNAYTTLGRLEYESGHLETAAELWQTALEYIQKRQLGGDDAESLILRAQLALILINQGKLERAERELLAVAKASEARHQIVVFYTSLQYLGKVYTLQKSLDKATQSLTRGILLTDETFGPWSPQSAMCRYELAHAYLASRRLEEALKVSQQAVEVVDRSQGVPAAWVDLLRLHGRILRKMKQRHLARKVELRVKSLAVSESSGARMIDLAEMQRSNKRSNRSGTR
jgi:tetratricopeptide (TPR) repeat protein